MPDETRTEWQPVYQNNVTEKDIYIEVAVRGGREEVGIAEVIPWGRVTQLLGNLAEGLVSALEKASPTKASVELGVEFGVQEGNLIALVARGTGKANLKVKLEWGK